MRINGRALAQQLGETLATEVAELSRAPKLRVFVLSKDKATEQFINIKKRAGERMGVAVDVVELPESTTTEELVELVRQGVASATTQQDDDIVDGIIVQLPLPLHIDFEVVRAELPASHDVDCLGVEAEARLKEGTHAILPPVVSAFAHILKENSVEVADKHVVVVGRGRLVGQPASVWFAQEGAQVGVIDKETTNIGELTRSADILALGAGAPHLIKPDMIKEGVIILDAGTSEAGGKVVGDADPECESKASIFTPVPGGIGPLAVMMIFKNLIGLLREGQNILAERPVPPEGAGSGA